MTVNGPSLSGGAVDQIAGSRQIGAALGEERGLAQDALRRLSEIDRHRRMDLVDEPVVVRVAVGDDEADDRTGRRGEARDAGQRMRFRRAAHRAAGRRRAPDAAVVLELDATAADLLRAAMDADTHNATGA